MPSASGAGASAPAKYAGLYDELSCGTVPLGLERAVKGERCDGPAGAVVGSTSARADDGFGAHVVCVGRRVWVLHERRRSTKGGAVV